MGKNILLKTIAVMCFFISSSALTKEGYRERRGVFAGVGVTYNFMTARFYRLYQKIDDAPGVIFETGYRIGAPLRIGARLWFSGHTLENPLFSTDKFRFQGLEVDGRVFLLNRTRLRPYLLLGVSKVTLMTSDDEGFRGFGYSFAAGLEYWLNRHWTLSSEVDVRYVEYTGIQVGRERRTLGLTNGSMVSLKLLKLTWFY